MKHKLKKRKMQARGTGLFFSGPFICIYMAASHFTDNEFIVHVKEGIKLKVTNVFFNVSVCDMLRSFRHNLIRFSQLSIGASQGSLRRRVERT